MTEFLLSVHVLVAIVTVGSITVAASMFPRIALRAFGGGGDGSSATGEGRDGRSEGTGTAVLLHRVCTGYAVAGVMVPVFGIATGAQLGVLTDAWLIVSLVLTVAAAALLGLAVLPGQRRLLALAEGAAAEEEARPVASRLSMTTGVFNVLWAVVVVLMIVRPGSTTGA
ncbi:hypothetical protein AMK27_08825 [Streptomyces sp. CB02009]|uniref:hypothetical protein n=1 Tax=Streptomyces sp. CB02009 TaxID=1703938 RepID=UPI00093C0DE4|nr:hypothetical protein [Streptomyces sp. CB02009]OKJ63091.1 hypothetical protein AMK27_08825 [Streptomyces sp. CB02009]